MTEETPQQEKKIDVRKKYSLSGPILNQDKIDKLVAKYKKKKNT